MEMIKVAGGSTGATAAHWRACCCSNQDARGFTEGIRRMRLGVPSSNRESLDSLSGLVTVWLLRIQETRRRGPARSHAQMRSEVPLLLLRKLATC